MQPISKVATPVSLIDRDLLNTEASFILPVQVLAVNRLPELVKRQVHLADTDLPLVYAHELQALSWCCR